MARTHGVETGHRAEWARRPVADEFPGAMRVLTAREAAAVIADGAVVTVSSSSGLGCPDAVLEAIESKGG